MYLSPSLSHESLIFWRYNTKVMTDELPLWRLGREIGHWVCTINFISGNYHDKDTICTLFAIFFLSNEFDLILQLSYQALMLQLSYQALMSLANIHGIRFPHPEAPLFLVLQSPVLDSNLCFRYNGSKRTVALSGAATFPIWRRAWAVSQFQRPVCPHLQKQSVRIPLAQFLNFWSHTTLHESPVSYHLLPHVEDPLMK